MIRDVSFIFRIRRALTSATKARAKKRKEQQLRSNRLVREVLQASGSGSGASSSAGLPPPLPSINPEDLRVQAVEPPPPSTALPLREYLAHVGPSRQLNSLQKLPAVMRRQQFATRTASFEASASDVKPEFSRLRSLLEGTSSSEQKSPTSFQGFSTSTSTNPPLERVYRVGPGPSASMLQQQQQQQQAYQMSGGHQVQMQSPTPMQYHPSLQSPNYGLMNPQMPSYSLSVDTTDTPLPRTTPISFYSAPPSTSSNSNGQPQPQFSEFSPSFPSDSMQIIRLKRSDSSVDVMNQNQDDRQRNPSATSLPTPSPRSRAAPKKKKKEKMVVKALAMPESESTPLSITTTSMSKAPSPTPSQPSPDSSSS